MIHNFCLSLQKLNIIVLLINYNTMLFKKIPILILIFSLTANISSSQTSEQEKIIEYNDTIQKFRKGKNIKLMYDEASPLTLEQRKSFSGLNYFAADLKFYVKGELIKEDAPEVVFMKTSTDRSPAYVKYGVVKFTIDTFNLILAVYQNKKMLDLSQDSTHLFVPFRDGTSGQESYGGGRYIDCEIPIEGKSIILDFNKAYNPYCSYNPKYSCVIPPEENQLSIRIEAGEKKFDENH